VTTVLVYNIKILIAKWQASPHDMPLQAQRSGGGVAPTIRNPSGICFLPTMYIRVAML